MSARPLAVDPRVVYRREKAKRDRRTARLLAQARAEYEAALAAPVIVLNKHGRAVRTMHRAPAPQKPARQPKPRQAPVPEREPRTCATPECGAVFTPAPVGKVSDYCPACRAVRDVERQRAQNRAATNRSRANRGLPPLPDGPVARLSWADVALKPCGQCGETMQRHVSRSGRAETPSEYQSRRYCGAACQRRAAIAQANARRAA